MVAVKAVAQDEVPTRRGARDPPGGRASVGAVLAEDNPLRARKQLRQELRDLDFVAMEERRDDGRTRVLEQRLAYDRVIVAEERRAEPQLEVDELTPVLVPETRPFPPARSTTA
jgi:hypothetical protein